MNKLYLLIIISVLCVGIINAVDEKTSWGRVDPDTQIIIKQGCSNGTSLCTWCNITASYPNSTDFLSANMNLIGSDFYYTINSTFNNVVSDDYTACTLCSDNVQIDKVCAHYSVGKDASISNAMFYIGLLVILLVLFSFLLYKMVSVQTWGWQMGMLSLSYFVLLIVVYILQQLVINFIPSLPIISQFLSLTITIMLILILPLVLGMIIYTLYKITNEREVKTMLNMGYSDVEARHLTKRR